MALTMGTVRPQRLTTGTNRGGSISLGTNTGMQTNAPSYGVTLGQGAINQQPVGTYDQQVLGQGQNINQQSTPYSPQQTAAPVGPSQAQVNPLLQSLGSLDTILGNRNSQSRGEYNRALAGYREQDGLDRQAFDQNTQQNESTLTSNNQRAMLNAANGASGLRGVLSSLGALAGSGSGVIERLVGLAANSDTGAARDTFDTNATGLNQAWGTAEREQRQRREDAKANLENNLQNNEANVLQSRQSIFQDLANLYGGESAEGRSYASQAGALAAPIARTSRATVAPYAKASSSFSPGALKEYLAGTQNLEVDTSAAQAGGSAPINSPLFAQDRRRENLPGVA